jgi:universal stress protein A
MLRYNHVLLATCLSPSCQKAAARAADIAKASNAKLSIIHVLEQTAAVYGGEFTSTINIDYEQQLERNIQTALHNIADEYDIEQENRYFKTGSIKHCVVDLAIQTSADLIVVGTHSHHGIDILLGSKANAILHVAKCDVLAVRIKDDA